MKRIVRNNILFLYMLMIVAVAYACQDNSKTIETSNQVNLKSNNFYIEKIKRESGIIKKFLLPGEEACVIFPYVKGSKIYSFCNKHGLWSKEVE